MTNSPSAEIILFPGYDCAVSEPSADNTVIAVLESYLGRAKTGDVQGVLIIASSERAPAECALAIGHALPLSLVGGLELAKQRLLEIAKEEMQAFEL